MVHISQNPRNNTEILTSETMIIWCIFVKESVDCQLKPRSNMQWHVDTIRLLDGFQLKTTIQASAIHEIC